MPDAYIFQADVHCGDCIREMLFDRALTEPVVNRADMTPADALESAKRMRGYESEADYDSDELPKGPYPDGGGEADYPQHCATCHTFLENPLTQDGYEYVIDALRSGDGDKAVLQEWRDYYGDDYATPALKTVNELVEEGE